MIHAETTAIDIPVKPPTHFEYTEKLSEKDSWNASPQISGMEKIKGGFVSWLSSSSYAISRIWFPSYLELPSPTVSKTDCFKQVIDLLHAEERAATVRVTDASENLYELRRLTGFTWDRLANLLNVDRRTLNNWVKGRKMRDWNREHIARTLEVLRFADRGSSELNAAALDERRVSQEFCPLEAIRLKNYETAKQYMSYGLSQPYSSYATTKAAFWPGEFQQIAMHPGADGTEKIKPLPDEPIPTYRKREIKRG